MPWMILSIVVCLLLNGIGPLVSPVRAATGDEICLPCHRMERSGIHGTMPCRFCHSLERGKRGGGRECNGCHQRQMPVLTQAMGTRSAEQAFVARSYARFDSGFWQKNCTGCHVQSCRQCHGTGHRLTLPTTADCQQCHKGYFTGWDYAGRAPREDNMRYQRGIAVNGETFLKMLPDVHYQAGMSCSHCHTMASLAGGKPAAKGCRDCHTPSRSVVEHRIAAHLERLECVACHAAWAPQEYGTFFLRFRDARVMEEFDLVPLGAGEYLRSAYLRQQGPPPLGLNRAGRVSPIRPQFIALYTDVVTARISGAENVLLAAEWRAFSPHTIRRGTVTCEGCHDTPRRFVQEPESQRIYRLRTDGIGLDSFWSPVGQRVSNGSFMPATRVTRMANKTPAYTRAYLEKWKTILNHVDTSSKP